MREGGISTADMYAWCSSFSCSTVGYKARILLGTKDGVNVLKVTSGRKVEVYRAPRMQAHFQLVIIYDHIITCVYCKHHIQGEEK